MRVQSLVRTAVGAVVRIGPVVVKLGVMKKAQPKTASDTFWFCLVMARYRRGVSLFAAPIAG
jgi:hypothetical protein